mmetsp:Transcript_10861/g.19448  ORF Transcript_10861/g.19448 Transcript_10861/m.19448 type:complete len:748 (-) Transcript_10861:45-2288(-)
MSDLASEWSRRVLASIASPREDGQGAPQLVDLPMGTGQGDLAERVLALIASPREDGQGASQLVDPPMGTGQGELAEPGCSTPSSEQSNEDNTLEASQSSEACGIVLDEFASEISDWLGAFGLAECSTIVLRWCQDRGVTSFFELPDFTGEFAAALDLEPTEALSMRRHAKSAWEAVLARKLATTELSNEELMNFADKLADSLELTQQEALGLWMRTANVFAAMHVRWRTNKQVDFSSTQPVDFTQELAEGLHMSRAQAQSFWSKACKAFLAETEARRSDTEPSKSSASEASLRPSRHGSCAKRTAAPRPSMPASPLQSSPVRLRQSTRSASCPRPGGNLDSRPSLLNSPARRSKQRPEWDASWEDDKTKHSSQQNFFDSAYRQPQYTLMHFRKDSQPAADAARRSKRPEWNTSWNDDWKKHSSQQKYFDSLHNQSQYTLMHFRKSKPNTIPEQHWWGAESKWWSTGSNSPASPSTSSGSPAPRRASSTPLLPRRAPSSVSSSKSDSGSPSPHSASSTPTLPRRAPSSPSLPRVGSQITVKQRTAHGMHEKLPSRSQSNENMQSQGRQQHSIAAARVEAALSVPLHSRSRGENQRRCLSHNEVGQTTSLQDPRRPAWDAMTCSSAASECDLNLSVESMLRRGAQDTAEYYPSPALGSDVNTLYLADQAAHAEDLEFQAASMLRHGKQAAAHPSSASGSDVNNLYLADQAARAEELDFQAAMSALRRKKNSLMHSAAALDRRLEIQPKF